MEGLCSGRGLCRCYMRLHVVSAAAGIWRALAAFGCLRLGCDVMCTPVVPDDLVADLWDGVMEGLCSGRGLCRCYRRLYVVSAVAGIGWALAAASAVCALIVI